MLDQGRVDVEEIATALADQTDYEHRWLIDPRTGEVAYWTRDTGVDEENPVEIDELDLVVIDTLPSYGWFQDMADFAGRPMYLNPRRARQYPWKPPAWVPPRARALTRMDARATVVRPSWANAVSEWTWIVRCYAEERTPPSAQKAPVLTVRLDRRGVNR